MAGSGGLAGFEPGLEVGGEDGPGGGFGGFVPQAGFDEALAGVAPALEDGAESVAVGVFEAGRGGVGGVGSRGFGDEIEEMEGAPVIVKEKVAGVEGGASKGDGNRGKFLDEFDAEGPEAAAGVVDVHVFGWDVAGFPVKEEAMEGLAGGGVPAGGPAGGGAGWCAWLRR